MTFTDIWATWADVMEVRLSKCQSMSSQTVLLKSTLTQTIIPHCQRVSRTKMWGRWGGRTWSHVRFGGRQEKISNWLQKCNAMYIFDLNQSEGKHYTKPIRTYVWLGHFTIARCRMHMSRVRQRRSLKVRFALKEAWFLLFIPLVLCIE